MINNCVNYNKTTQTKASCKSDPKGENLLLKKLGYKYIEELRDNDISLPKYILLISLL